MLFCGDTVIDAATAQAGGCDFCAVLNGTTKVYAITVTFSSGAASEPLPESSPAQPSPAE